MPETASSDLFTHFYVRCPDTGLVSVKSTATPITAEAARKRFAADVKPQRDASVWAVARDYGKRFSGVYLESDDPGYFNIRTPVRFTNIDTRLEAEATGLDASVPALEHQFCRANATLTLRPQTFQCTYAWLNELAGQTYDRQMVVNYLGRYDLLFGHLDEIPGFWDDEAAETLIHHLHLCEPDCDRSKLYWNSVSMLLRKGDRTAHDDILKTVSGRHFSDILRDPLNTSAAARAGCPCLTPDMPLPLDEVLPYVSRGLYLPRNVILKCAESRPSSHEKVQYLGELSKAVSKGRALAPYRTHDFFSERSQAICRVLKFIRKTAPRHPLADTLLYQWEMHKDGDLCMDGLREQTSMLARSMVPAGMLELDGQPPLKWSEVMYRFRFVPWLRKWYNSI